MINRNKDTFVPQEVLSSLGRGIEDISEYNLYEEHYSGGVFHIHQCYEEEPVSILVCKLCEGKEFNVGTGNYFTGIRCINCGWEHCVHSG